MKAVLSRQRILPAVAAFAVGITVSSLIHTPFGLLAPLVALFLLASDRAGLLLHAASATGLIGSLLVAAFYEGEARDVAFMWAAFFVLAICIGALVATRTSASSGAEAMPGATQGTTREQAPSYPVIGPTLEEKATPRHSPLVSISAQDDKATTAQLVAVSFWAGLPFHLRYWRRQVDGRYRWVESRSEPLREPSGPRLWRAITAEVDDQGSGKTLPTKIAFNPPRDDDAVRAAKIVENLLGNAWAFDPAGRPTYLTPLAQTFVAVTLEEFQTVVDEGHTFFKRTAHPDDYERISAAWRRSLQTGDPFFLDRRIRRASGIHEWNRTGFVPARDGQGRITGWYGSMIDLDSHRIALAELRDREQELSQLVAMVPSHLWRLAPDGEPIFFSKRMVDFLGLDVADIDKPGMSRLEALVETIHPDDAAAFRDTLRRCLVTGESFAMRYRLRRADGAYRWMSSHAEPMRDQNERIVQWYGLCQDIEDQVHAEEALRQSERGLREIIDVVPAAIGCLAPNGDPTFCSKRLIDLLGLDITDVEKPGMSRKAAAIATALHPDDAALFAGALNHSLVTGESFSERYRLRHADGVYRWVEGRIEPLRDQDGMIVQWYGVTFDIEDQVHTEDALRERERELSQLVDMVPSLLWRLNPDGEPNFLNKRAIDFLGLDVADYDKPGMTRLSAALAAIVHPDDAAGVTEALNHSFATGKPFASTHRLRRADGVYRWASARAEPMRDESGRIIQWYGLAHDIDDQVHAEEALRENEQSLRQLVDTLPTFVWAGEPNGEPSYMNRRLVDYIGLTPGDLDVPGSTRLQEAIQRAIHPEDSDLVQQALAHSLSTGEPFATKYRHRRADGVYRWANSRAEPLRDSNGRIVRWYGLVDDIDDEVRTQEELRWTRDKLARSEQAASLAELSASIAHEVNQPLAAIVANSHACQRWLKSDPPNLERAQTTVERIIRDANSAADVVSRIRALFKQSVETKTSTTLPGIIAEAINLMAEEAARRRVRMDVDVEDNLPLVAFDRVQLQQVLINLIRNGMDAMASAATDRVIGMRVRRMGDVVQTEISDRGPGIKFPDRIFEPFFTTKESGMGMGLAICRSIVESHGGRLWAEKEKPHGATFIFTLPVEEKAAP